MSWRNGERGQKEIVQCLYGSDPAPHVLVQARLTSAIVVAPHSSHGFPDDMLIVQPLTLYSDAERVGVKIAPEYRCIEAAHATTNALSLKIRLPRVTGEPLSYGPSLLASVLTGSVCLHERAAIPYLDTKVLCFYRANALAFDPRGASEDTEIAIERSEADGSMHVIARDSDGRRILELCGLQIRKVPKHEHKVVPTTSTAARTALAS